LDLRYIQWLKSASDTDSAPVGIEELIQIICRTLDVNAPDLCCPSRNRRLTLARALTAWHALNNNIASLSTIARRFNRDPSTVYTAIERYRHCKPQLFDQSLKNLLEIQSTEHAAVAS
jgi:chromosomal replication initiation ATPase DnaA